jgi:hypothetical protein
VYCEFIGKRHHSQVATTELRSGCPEAESVILLGLDSDWCLNHADTHLLREIRTLRKDFVLEIGRELDGQTPTTLNQMMLRHKTGSSALEGLPAPGYRPSRYMGFFQQFPVSRRALEASGRHSLPRSVSERSSRQCDRQETKFCSIAEPTGSFSLYL